MKCSIAAGILAGLLAASATAQTTYTWSGLAGDFLFNTPGNWQGGVVPTGNMTDNIVFPDLPLSVQAAGGITTQITTPVNLGNITFSGNYYSHYLSGAGPLTLNGNVAALANLGSINVPVNLSAGNHIYSGSGYIFQNGAISGPGSITMNGPGFLGLFSDSNSYTGGTILNAGTLGVAYGNSLGTGLVTFNGGLLRASTLTNNFALGANVAFDSSGLIVLGDSNSTITSAVGVGTVNLTLNYGHLNIAGAMINGSGPTTYTFANDNYSYGYTLSGNNTYSGGTLVKSGASLYFSTPASLPSSGLITVESGGYAGLTDSTVSTSTYLSRFNPATTTGTIGFDNGTYAGNIDLSSFTANEGEVSIGTQNGATLTGAITAPSGSGQIHFRNSGTLFLEGSNPLTGSINVWSTSFPGRTPGLLVLNQSAPNTYSGTTIADGAGIVFDSAGSMPTGTSLQLRNRAYVSFTENSGLTLNDLVSKVSLQSGAASILGIDRHDAVYGIAYPLTDYSDPINFSSLTSPVYLGTVSSTNVTGTITTTNDGTDGYFLTGYNGGWLKISSQLTGSRQVHIGINTPDLSQDIYYDDYSTVELANPANNYTGGTVLHSGLLVANNPLALPGTLTVDAGSTTDGTARLRTGGTFANNIILQDSTLDIEANSPLSLTGIISGTGWLSSSTGNNFTISGNNTYSGGSYFSWINITASSNTALGSGSLSLFEGARVTFDYNASSPVIGSLYVGDPHDNGEGFNHAALVLAGDGGTSTLTINQTEDGSFAGAILESSTTGILVKNGPASLTIGGDRNGGNVYSGGTTINEGKLIAGSSTALGSGAITINGGGLGTAYGVVLPNAISFGASGGTLSGSGIFTVPITAGTNVVLSPGDSPGTMTFTAGLTLAPGGSMNFEVQSASGIAGTGYDLVSVSGGTLDITATTGSPFTLHLISLDFYTSAGNVTDFNSSAAYTWTLFSAANPISFNPVFDPANFLLDTSLFTNNLNGGAFYLSSTANALQLNFSPAAVPEPSTYALILAGVAAAFVSSRRRNRIAP